LPWKRKSRSSIGNGIICTPRIVSTVKI
jgi:hypothetical protein